MQISMKLSTGQDSGNSPDQTNPTNKMMDTVEKPSSSNKKDGFEIEVADEHGKAGQVEIDSPEEELQERMYPLFVLCASYYNINHSGLQFFCVSVCLLFFLKICFLVLY